jgi:hypothetical protein
MAKLRKQSKPSTILRLQSPIDKQAAREGNARRCAVKVSIARLAKRAIWTQTEKMPSPLEQLPG